MTTRTSIHNIRHVSICSLVHAIYYIHVILLSAAVLESMVCVLTLTLMTVAVGMLLVIHTLARSSASEAM